MPTVECTQLRYHCTKLPDIDLCPQAFADGRFPAGCSAKDFIRIDQSDSEARLFGVFVQSLKGALEADHMPHLKV